MIINPKASKGKGKINSGAIASYLEENGFPVAFAETRGQNDAFVLAQDAIKKGYRMLIVGGGDGTLNEVLNGIMTTDPSVSLAIIPLGRGNDYAYSLSLPNDVRKAMDVIIDGHTRMVDVGLVKGGDRLDGRYFLNGNGYGFEPLVNFRAMEYRHINGILSYVIAFISMMIHVPPSYSVELELDGEKYDLETQQISFTLGKRMGSCFMLAPDAVLDDGLFDFLCTTHPLHRSSLFLSVLKFLMGSHVRDKKNFMIKRIKSGVINVKEGKVYSHADGEVVAKGNGKRFEISILPSVLKVFVPE